MFVFQLYGISFWRTVWVTRYCCFVSKIHYIYPPCTKKHVETGNLWLLINLREHNVQDIFHKRPSGFQTVFGFAQRCEYTDMSVCTIAVNNINPLNAELNPICYLLALLGAHRFLHVSRIRVKSLPLRLLMSYIYDITSLRVKEDYCLTECSAMYIVT